MRRSSSSRSLRRASSPLPLLSGPNAPRRGRLRRTTSTPSLCFQSWSLSEVPRSPTTPPTSPFRQHDTAALLSDIGEAVDASGLLSHEQGFSDWDPDLPSRSAQVELHAEGSTQTERLSCPKDVELLHSEESGFAVLRFLGVHGNKSFLVSLAVLAAVVFTVAVVATLSGTSNANKKINSLDLGQDGFESEQASAHKDAMVTAASTARRMITVHRMRAARKVISSRKAAAKGRKKARISHRNLRTRAKEHRTRFTTTRPSTRKQAKSRRRPRTVPTIRRRGGKKKVSSSRRSPKGRRRLATGKNRTTTTTASGDDVSTENDLAQESEEPKESSSAPSLAA
ncbi:uncharacterized protein LOC144094331 isoform X2 [Amblyomma americanum]